MEEQPTAIELQDRQRARIKSGVAFLILFAVLVLPIMSYQTPPPEREGVLVRLGGDFGQGPDNSSKGTEVPIAAPKEVVEEDVEPATDPEPKKEKKKKKKTTQKPDKKVVTSDNSKELAIKRAKEKKKREEEAQEAAAAAEAKRKRDAAAAKRKAEKDAAANMDFGIETGGSGGGNDGKGGTSGRPDGSPDGLSKLGSGQGRVGGGLGSRGRDGSVSRLKEKSNKAGTVVVRICVNSSGRVTSASVTQSGTTIQDAGLHSAAVRNAKLFKFNKSSMDKQCGTVTYRFKVH